MHKNFAVKEELINFRQTGVFSKALFTELQRFAQIVLRSKGVSSLDDQENIFSLFLQKMLKYQGNFYRQLEAYHEKQIRTFLAMTLKCCMLDYFRAQKQGEESLDQHLAADFLPSSLREVFVSLHPYYLLEAQAICSIIWNKLNLDLQEVFCLHYEAGTKIEDIARLKKVSLGKVDKDKKRIAQAIASEASLVEVAGLVYNFLARTMCVGGQPIAAPHLSSR